MFSKFCLASGLVSLFLFTTLNSQAKNLHPEIFYQPLPGMFATSLSYTYQVRDITDELSSVVTTDSGIGQGMEFDVEYGVWLWLAFGVGFDYERFDSEVTANGSTTFIKKEGLGDYRLKMKVAVPITRTRIYLGVEYNLSGENNKQSGSNPQFFSRSTGGNSLVGTFGVQMPMGPLWIGVRGDMTMFDKRTLDVDGVATTAITGGEELDILANFEAHGNMSVFGVGAGVFQKQKQTTTILATSVSSTVQSLNKTRFRVYYSTKMGWLTVLLEANYFTLKDVELSSSDTRVDSREIDGKVTLRFTF